MRGEGNVRQSDPPSILAKFAHLLRPIRWRNRHAQASELLKRVGADIDPSREVRRLSMPEQQLVEIARAVGTGARILILDEPTASLTKKEVELLYAVIRDLRSRGVGMIYISHRLEEIFAIADRVTVLRDGESVGTNPIDSITETQLIRMMVGREVSAIYPPRDSSVLPLPEGEGRGEGKGVLGNPGRPNSMLPSPSEISAAAPPILQTSPSNCTMANSWPRWSRGRWPNRTRAHPLSHNPF